MPPTTYIDTVEAAYDLEAPTAPWLKRIAETAQYLDGGHGVMAWTFDARDPRGTTQVPSQRWGGRPEFEQIPARFDRVHGAEMHKVMSRAWTATTSSVEWTACGYDWERWKSAVPHDVADCLAVKSVCPSGVGVILIALLREVRSITERTRGPLSHLAAHLAAGHRLRIALVGEAVNRPEDQSEAVLLPNGRCQHAEPAAATRTARDALRAAAQRIDRARGKLRRSDPEEALSFWRGLVAGRWSLVDRFDTDGRRFVVALRNDPQLPDPRALSLGERQVLGYAMLGHSLKLTGYELGISSSTVSERLSRATRKLGARSRAELVSLLSSATARPLE